MTRALPLNTLVFCLCTGLFNSAQATDLSFVKTPAQAGECTVQVDGRSEPAIAFTAAGYGVGGIDKREVMALLEQFVANGCSLDEPDTNGATALNLAVLTAEPELLGYLLKAGANPALPVAIDKPWAKGLNNLELARFVYKRQATDNRKLNIELLQQASNP